jgi:heat shock protein HslJ
VINPQEIIMRSALGIALAGATLLSACAASSTAPEQPVSLANTSWDLVMLRLDADNPAEIRPVRPDQYRLSFQADGRVTVQIDCNRGSGTWQATPAGQGGGLRLGPLALTRMMCPPDALGQRLPQDLEAVQSYHIVDGRLQLELASNAGRYTWKREQP